MHEDIISNALCQAKVISLCKGKGGKSDPASYRLISLTDVAGKVLERIIVGELSTYITTQLIISMGSCLIALQ